MSRSNVLVLTALLSCGVLSAQKPASSPAQAPVPASPSQIQGELPVPGGTPAGLDRPAPTKEEAMKRAKEQADQIADMQARRLTQQLSLTSAQYVKVRTILMGRQEDLRKAFEGTSPDAKELPKTPQERQAVIQQAQQETQRKIAAILTPDQKIRFDAMMKRGQDQRSRRAAAARARRPVIGAQGEGTGSTAAPATAPAADPGKDTAAPAADPAATPKSK